MDRESVDEIKRHFSVVAEDLRSEVRAVAEGQQGLKLVLDEFRADVAREFEDVRGLIRLSYGELDRRVQSLESEVTSLRERLERIEDRFAS